MHIKNRRMSHMKGAVCICHDSSDLTARSSEVRTSYRSSVLLESESVYA